MKVVGQGKENAQRWKIHDVLRTLWEGLIANLLLQQTKTWKLKENNWLLKFYNSLILGDLYIFSSDDFFLLLQSILLAKYNSYCAQVREKKPYNTGNRDGKDLDRCILISHSFYLNRTEDTIQQNREAWGKTHSEVRAVENCELS